MFHDLGGRIRPAKREGGQRGGDGGRKLYITMHCFVLNCVCS